MKKGANGQSTSRRIWGNDRGKRTCLCRLSLLVAILVSCSWNPGNAAELGGFEGYYARKSTDCSVFFGEEKETKCPPEVIDCLRIKKVGDGSYEIQVHVVQANMHVCEIEGTARLQGDTLVYIDPELESFGQERGQGVGVRIGKKELSISYLLPPKIPVPFCGAQASLDGVTFSRDQRTPSDRECVLPWTEKRGQATLRE